MASNVKVIGGGKVKGIAKKAERNRSIGYDVGFFPKAKYSDGTPVALVGLWQEYGTRRPDGGVQVPEHPYFRGSNKKAEKMIRTQVKRMQDPKTKTLSKSDAGKIAAAHAAIVQEGIVTLRQPPNAQGTIKIKGSSNPLVNTGLMLQSVSWEITDGS